MKLTEMEEKCKNIEKFRKEREQQLASLKGLELEAKRKSKEAQMLKEIAKIRGEEPPEEPKLEEHEKAKEAAESLENEVKKLESEVYEGMKHITFPIPQEIPKVDPRGNSTIFLEEGPYNYAVKFIAATISSDVPLELDKTQFHPDKIVVTNVKDAPSVIDRLTLLRNNFGRLGKIALQEQDPDVEEVVEYLRKSEYRELWEAIKGRKRISYNEIFSDLNISAAKDRKRVRNFFTNLKKQLEDKFPFIPVASGIYELSFFGSLVWKRYTDKYPLENFEVALHEEAVKPETKKEEAEMAALPSLNKYLSNEDRELIYGKEGS